MYFVDLVYFLPNRRAKKPGFCGAVSGDAGAEGVSVGGIVSPLGFMADISAVVIGSVAVASSAGVGVLIVSGVATGLATGVSVVTVSVAVGCSGASVIADEASSSAIDAWMSELAVPTAVICSSLVVLLVGIVSMAGSID